MLPSLDNSLFSYLRRAGDLGRRLMEMGETVRLPRVTRKEGDPGAENIAAARDQLELSEAIRQLQATGLDLNRSGVVQKETQFNFNFQFQDEQVRMLTSNGFYDTRSQSVKMDLSFRSTLTVVDPETGAERQELFELNFRMELSDSSVQPGDPLGETDGILKFARKLLNRVVDLNAQGKPIDGLELKAEDLRDLGGVEDGRLLRSILNLIHLIHASDPMQPKTSPYASAGAERPKPRSDADVERFQAEFSLSVARVSQELVYQGIDEISDAA